VGPPRTVDTVSKRLYFQVRNQCHRMRSCRSTPVKKSPTSLRRFSKFFCSLLYFCSTSATPQSLLPLLFLLLLLVSTPPFLFLLSRFLFFLSNSRSPLFLLSLLWWSFILPVPTLMIPISSRINLSLSAVLPPLPNEKLRTFQYSQKNR